MKVFTKNNMVFWEMVEDAALYVVHLYIGATSWNDGRGRFEIIRCPSFLSDKHKMLSVGDVAYQQVNEIVIDKVKTYHTFTDLVDISWEYRSDSTSTRYSTHLDYFVSVSAEDKLGNTIEKSEQVLIKIHI